MSEATFDYATSINWDKSWVTRFASRLVVNLGGQPRMVLRPRILEDPELALAAGFLVSSAGVMALLYLTRLLVPKRGVR